MSGFTARLNRESGENPEQSRCCKFLPQLPITPLTKHVGKAGSRNESEDLPVCMSKNSRGKSNGHNGSHPIWGVLCCAFGYPFLYVLRSGFFMFYSIITKTNNNETNFSLFYARYCRIRYASSGGSLYDKSAGSSMEFR